MSQETQSSREHRDALIREVLLEARSAQTATDVLDEAATFALGINRTDGRCLDIIERSGGVTAGQLATESGLTTGAVTAVLDRLERAGYVRRVRDVHDRRRVLVELTPEGHALGRDIYGPLAETSRGLLVTFTDEQLIAVRDFLRAGRELNIEMAQRLRERAIVGDVAALKRELRGIKQELKDLVRREFTEPAKQMKRDLEEPFRQAKREWKAQAQTVKQEARVLGREARAAVRRDRPPTAPGSASHGSTRAVSGPEGPGEDGSPSD